MSALLLSMLHNSKKCPSLTVYETLSNQPTSQLLCCHNLLGVPLGYGKDVIWKYVVIPLGYENDVTCKHSSLQVVFIGNKRQNSTQYTFKISKQHFGHN